MPDEGYYEDTAGSGFVINSTTFGWHKWDVTGMLQEEIDVNNRDFSLEAIAVNLVGDCGSGSVPSFYSEESANSII